MAAKSITRKIIDTFEAHGVAGHQIVASGGLADHSKLVIRIYADVTGRQLRIARSSQVGRWARQYTRLW